MLSSATEAEDLVQDVWLRWQTTDRSVVVNPAAFLATTTTRLAINALQSARVRRETYIGPWLPEPVDTSADPYLGAERGEALEFAALMLMEKLTPNERAAYVLREAFDYPYAQIADILRSSEPAVRQLVSRARKHMADERRPPVSAAAQKELLTTFIDGRPLRRHGRARAALRGRRDQPVRRQRRGARRPPAGRRRAAGGEVPGRGLRLVLGRRRRAVGRTNGQTSAVLWRGGTVYGLLTVSASAEGIDQVLWMFNPDKIAAVTGTGRHR